MLEEASVTLKKGDERYDLRKDGFSFVHGFLVITSIS